MPNPVPEPGFLRENWPRLLFLAVCIPALITANPALVVAAGVVGFVLWPLVIAG